MNQKEYSSKKLYDKLTTFLIENKLTVDLFLYMIDGSIPRYDQSEYDCLRDFIKCMKVVYKEDLDYWKKILLVITKGNMIKNDDINGFPKYKYKSFLKKIN